jgi:hypothetical protein
MSYILDSLKKSEKERQTTDNAAAVAIQSPEFLNNEKPSRSPNIYFGVAILAVLILGFLVYFFFFKSAVNEKIFTNNASTKQINSDTSKINGTSKKEVFSVNDKKPSLDDGVETVGLPKSKITNVAQSISSEKEKAVALYQQAIVEKSQSEVDSLYKKLKKSTVQNQQLDQKLSALPEEAKNEAVNSQQQMDVDLAITDANQEPSNQEITQANEDSDPVIPRIYQLDPLLKRNIPQLNYGAHIYASDNKSGFVILNGARRRLGDQLDNGVYIEKIREEDVVLSYNGTVFSLPAMKNWEGN